MTIFLVLAGLAELALGILVYLSAPTITQEIFSAILLCASFITFGLAELVHIAARADARLADLAQHLRR